VINPSVDFWKNRRVLVTGHSGFKGSWLTLWLNKMGAEVLGLSIDDRQQQELFHVAEINELCTSIVADLTSPKSWEQQILEFSPEVVFHLAAQSLVRTSYDEPVLTFDTNVMGTVNLLERLRHHQNLKSIVVATTDKVYRDVHLRSPFKEDDHLGGHDPYSASKAACEIAVASYKQSFFEQRQIALSVGRAGNVIGGGDWADNRLIPDAIRAWSAGEELVLRNPGHTRPWQHVLEPLLGYLILAERTVMDCELASPFNFGPLGSQQFSVGDIIKLASQHYPGARVSFRPQDDAQHESDWLDLNANRARQLLSVESRLSLEQSIFWTIDWYVRFIDGQSPAHLCEEQITNFLNSSEIS
jgi:CDP-glucose 4,6-dehydratase